MVGAVPLRMVQLGRPNIGRMTLPSLPASEVVYTFSTRGISSLPFREAVCASKCIILPGQFLDGVQGDVSMVRL